MPTLSVENAEETQQQEPQSTCQVKRKRACRDAATPRDSLGGSSSRCLVAPEPIFSRRIFTPTERGAESTLTENAAFPFPAEPPHPTVNFCYQAIALIDNRPTLNERNRDFSPIDNKPSLLCSLFLQQIRNLSNVRTGDFHKKTIKSPVSLLLTLCCHRPSPEEPTP